MEPGTLIADRFEIAHTAGVGGMGTVYRAQDRRTGRLVALKVLHPSASGDADRFEREARTIASLDHPGIVGYIDYGVAAGGTPYLAMEWLEGTSLRQRLDEGPLPVADVLAMGDAVLDALEYAHGRGLVHRDLKPANLFLVDHAAAQVKLLDFGVVRLADPHSALTASGQVVGTPAYMAPEQARGDSRLDARADLHSVGSVLFEAITGRRVFAGQSPMAVLLRVVLAEPPRLDELCAETPSEIVELVAQLLAKDPAARPASATAVRAALAGVPLAPTASRSPLGPTGTVVSSHTTTADDWPKPHLTDESQRIRFLLVTSEPLSAAVPGLWESVVAAHGGTPHRLIDGTRLVTFANDGAATEQAATAGRCALDLCGALPLTAAALVAARTHSSGAPPLAEVIDRAVAFLSRSEPPATSVVVRIDRVVAGLLDRRFVVGGDDAGLLLLEERAFEEPRRTLLGVPTRLAGRGRELGWLQTYVDGWLRQRSAQVLLLLGAAGIGKSRLRDEMLDELTRRGAPVQIWLGRPDSVGPRSAHGLMASAIRSAIGMLVGEPLAVSRERLRARVGRHLAPADEGRVTEFLAELTGVPVTDGASTQLEAARLDMRLMGDQIRRACHEWMRAEARAEPIVIVLEDLQWGDPASVRSIERLIVQLRDYPLLVVGCARPEVDERFSHLFAAASPERLELSDLPTDACAQLAHTALGERAGPRTVARIVEQAAGNPFFLEELIRSVAEGRQDEFPGTVLAVSQARLESLDGLARQVLRAASVFGREFALDGVMCLLGGEVDAAEVAPLLERLATDEWLTPRLAASAPGRQDYAFRDAVVREASYATLTADDRVLGHRLAATWLERAGLAEPLALARHCEEGGLATAAVRWYQRATERALEGDDLDGAFQCAEQGIRAGATWEALGALLRMQAEALRWRGDIAAAEQKALEAMRHLTPRSEAWYQAAAEVALASGPLGHHRRVAELGEQLSERWRQQVPSLAETVALAAAATHLLFAGQGELAQTLLSRLAKAAAPDDGTERPAVLARVTQARAVRAVTSGDPAETLALLRRCVSYFERAGDLRNACIQRGNVGFSYLELGDHRSAERSLEASAQQADRLGLASVSAGMRLNLSHAFCRAGRTRRALQLGSQAVVDLAAHGNRRMLSAGHAYLAEAYLAERELDRAREQAQLAVATAAGEPQRAYGLAMVSRAELALGQVGPAHRAAHEARLLLRLGEDIDEGDALIRLVYAEALWAEGRRGRARRAIAEARVRLMERAHKIADKAWRRSYLESVPDHARVLELADLWLREEPEP